MRLFSVCCLLIMVLVAACSDFVQPDPKSPSATLTIDPTPNPVQIYGAWHCSNDFLHLGLGAWHDRFRRHEPLAGRPR